MKKLIMLLGIFLLSISANAQNNCAIYRKGYFMFTDSLENTILVQRRNKYQYQYNRKIKVRTQFRINWKNDCEYTITQTSTNSKSLKKYKNSVSVVIISKGDGLNGYYYTCNCKEENVKRKEAFMKKITKQAFYKLY